jgi:hypothetical protein
MSLAQISSGRDKEFYYIFMARLAVLVAPWALLLLTLRYTAPT